MVLYICNPSYLGGGGKGNHSLRQDWGENQRMYLKSKRIGSVAQVVEHKSEALSSIPSS
jgi:hypothetical protein